jgi:hypothetical protein
VSLAAVAVDDVVQPITNQVVVVEAALTLNLPTLRLPHLLRFSSISVLAVRAVQLTAQVVRLVGTHGLTKPQTPLQHLQLMEH